MADSTFSKIKEDLANDPATERLKQELQSYLAARATKAVSGLGSKLGQSVSKLGGQDGGSGLAQGLAKTGEALKEGKSPQQAALSFGKSQVTGMVKDKVKGVFGKGGGGQDKKAGGGAKGTTIIEDLDVGVPLREAYNQWTQFQEFSSFAKGVTNVELPDEMTSKWQFKIAMSSRSIKATVDEQIPDERIAWTSEGSKGTVKGVVTFHSLGPNLTKVLLVLEYFPDGIIEKTGNLWRAQGRRARLDFKLFRKFIMMNGEATDAWRGEIRDGEVVRDHDEVVKEEQEREQRGRGDGEDRDDEARGADRDEDDRDEESEDSYDGEDGEGADEEADRDEEPEDSYDDEDEEEDREDDQDLEDEADRDEDDEEPGDRYEDEEPEDEPAEEEPPRRRRTAGAGRR